MLKYSKVTVWTVYFWLSKQALFWTAEGLPPLYYNFLEHCAQALFSVPRLWSSTKEQLKRKGYYWYTQCNIYHFFMIQ